MLQVFFSLSQLLKHGVGSTFFSKDVKLNALLLVTSPVTMLFLQEVMGSFNLHTCQQSRVECCCWNRCVAPFQVVRQQDHAFEQQWVKTEGRERKGERGETVIHRENFHLINWLFTCHWQIRAKYIHPSQCIWFTVCQRYSEVRSFRNKSNESPVVLLWSWTASFIRCKFNL